MMNRTIFEKAYRAQDRARRLPRGSEMWNVSIVEWDVYRETLQDLNLWDEYITFCVQSKGGFLSDTSQSQEQGRRKPFTKR